MKEDLRALLRLFRRHPSSSSTDLSPIANTHKSHAHIPRPRPQQPSPSPPHAKTIPIADLKWPKPHPDSESDIPTPYQIFGISPSEPYSRARYLALVKIYHPDSLLHASDPEWNRLSRHARLERYRMVVAANELLSNDLKRSAYNKYGIGWHGRPAFPDLTRPYDSNEMRDGSFSGFGYNSTARHGTWEDWETYWVNKAGNKKPEEVYMKNSTFIVLALCVAAVLGVSEMTLLERMNQNRVERIRKGHVQNAYDWQSTTKETHKHASNSERMFRFMERRGGEDDPADIGAKVVTDE